MAMLLLLSCVSGAALVRTVSHDGSITWDTEPALIELGEAEDYATGTHGNFEDSLAAGVNTLLSVSETHMADQKKTIGRTSLPENLGPALAGVRMFLSDLDGTLYKKLDSAQTARNLNAARTIRQTAVSPGSDEKYFFLPATGNNIALAARKLIVADGSGLAASKKELTDSPGIYCNGGLVLGDEGKELRSSVVEREVVRQFLDDHFNKLTEELRSALCIVSLSKAMVYYYRESGGNFPPACTEFTKAMNLEDADWKALTKDEFLKEQTYSLLILAPKGNAEEDKFWQREILQSLVLPDKSLAGQAEVERAFRDQYKVTTKLHRVSVLGWEIDINGQGINKGSAVELLLKSPPFTHIGYDNVACFGDAANDLELMGMIKNKDGEWEAIDAEGKLPSLMVAVPDEHVPADLIKLTHLSADVSSVLDVFIEAAAVAAAVDQ